MQPRKHTNKHVIPVSTCLDFLQIHPDYFYRCKRPCLLISFLSDAHNQVGTLSGIITILFDTAVVAVTTFNTLAILRLQKGVNIQKAQSLVGVLIQQGVHISLLVDVLLNAMKVWLDMGNSYFMLSFIHLNIV